MEKKYNKDKIVQFKKKKNAFQFLVWECWSRGKFKGGSDVSLGCVTWTASKTKNGGVK